MMPPRNPHPGPHFGCLDVVSSALFLVCIEHLCRTRGSSYQYVSVLHGPGTCPDPDLGPGPEVPQVRDLRRSILLEQVQEGRTRDRVPDRVPDRFGIEN